MSHQFLEKWNRTKTKWNGKHFEMYFSTVITLSDLDSFRFVSYFNGTWLCLSVSVYKLTLHDTWDKRNKPKKLLRNRKRSAMLSLPIWASGNSCMLTRTDSLYSHGCCYEWLFAKGRGTFGLWKLSLKKNHIEWNVSNLKFKWKRFENRKNKWEGIFHVLNSSRVKGNVTHHSKRSRLFEWINIKWICEIFQLIRLYGIESDLMNGLYKSCLNSSNPHWEGHFINRGENMLRARIVLCLWVTLNEPVWVRLSCQLW